MSRHSNPQEGHGPFTHFDVVYNFRTAQDAANALVTHHIIRLGPHYYETQPYYNADGLDSIQALADREAQWQISPPSSEISPPRKRMRLHDKEPEPKVKCNICFELQHKPYSTPCRRCKMPNCYECLANRFKIALKNMDRLPVTCCGMVIHHEVVKGILEPAEIEDYKQKYDERMNATNPLYCPVPTCSTFIPPRLFRNNTDNKVVCHVCATTICTKCKQNAGENHVCAAEDPQKFLLTTFQYKLCPKCGTGVAKMFGCPHIRCSCNAHWCWDCQRPMNACYMKPCQSSREDGNASEAEYVEGDSDDGETGYDIPRTPPVAAAEPVADASTSASPTESENEIATILDSLRGPPVNETSPAVTPTCAPEAAIEVLPAGQSVVPTGSTAELTLQRGSAESTTAEQPPTLTRSDADLCSATLLSIDYEEAGMSTPHPYAHSDGMRTPNEREYMLDTQSLERAMSWAARTVRTDDQSAQTGNQHEAPADVSNETTTNGENPETSTAQPTDTIANLDDPDQTDWAHTDLNFGHEPTDESWDTWGCQHHFQRLDKHLNVPFWLVGVDPARDPNLKLECMGCFEKSTVWNDEAELEAFRAEHVPKDGVALSPVSLQIEWEMVLKEAEALPDDMEGSAAIKKRVKKKTGHMYECRHGCGVIYCKSCKKESVSRIKKDRKGGAEDD